MNVFLDIVSWALLSVGGFLCITGGIGIHRFPDFFSRMHAAGVTETLGSGLILIGMMLQTGWELTILVKLSLILLFILLTSPTASHALAKAALHGGLRPKLGKHFEQAEAPDNSAESNENNNL